MRLSHLITMAGLLLLPFRSFTGDSILALHQIVLLVGVFSTVVKWRRQSYLLTDSTKVVVAFTYTVILLIFVSYFRWGFDYEPTAFLRDVKNLFLPIMAALALSLSGTTTKQALGIVKGAAIGGALVALLEFGLWQLNSSAYTFLFNMPFDGVRHTAGFIGPNSYGLYLALIGTVLSLIALYEPSLRSAWIFWGLSVALVPVLLTTYSRGSVGLAALGFGVVLLLARWRARVGLIAGGTILLLVLGSDAYWVARMTQLFSGIDDRTNLASTGLVMMLDHPLTGVGLTRYGYLSMEVFNELKVPHNEYVKFAAELGLPGLLVLLGLLLGLMFLAAQAVRRAQHPEAKLLAGLSLAVVMILIAGEFFFNYLFESRVAVLFWLFLLPTLSALENTFQEEGA